MSLALAACSPPDATTTSAAAPTNSRRLRPCKPTKTRRCTRSVSPSARTFENVSDFKLTADEAEIVADGLSDAVLGAEPKVALDVYGPQIQGLAEERMSAGASRRESSVRRVGCGAGGAPGAERSATGVVVIPMTEGTGANPTATSTVRVHYHGTLRDGTVFDSSVQRGEPISFPLNGVIPCWTEGVQKIKVGGKAKLVCPSDTAYGDQGSGSIPGGAALAFEVELLAIE